MMMDSSKILLLANVALSFYLAGTIWAHEVDIFRSWKLIDSNDFPTVQRVHWRKLPYWIFTPLGLALIGSIGLIWYHSAGSPGWAIFGNLGCQVASLFLTVIFWGRWQGQLSKDSAGPNSIYLARILNTHWVRTVLVNTYAFIMLAWAIKVFALAS
jgi:hypothetical protein